VAFADGFTNSGLAAFASGCNGWKNEKLISDKKSSIT